MQPLGASQGGSLHLSFPTPRGFLLLMESAGFALGAMATYRDYANGAPSPSLALSPRIITFAPTLNFTLTFTFEGKKLF